MEKDLMEFEIPAPRLLEGKELASLGLKSDINKAFIEFTLNHTLPSINSRGRCVSYRTQKRSIATAHDNLINIEHTMVSNPNEAVEDRIVGFMKDVSIEEIADNPVVPPYPVPTKVIGVLWKRVDGVEKILNEINTSTKKWMMSMECLRDPSTDAIYYDGQFVPMDSAPEDLASCVGSDRCEAYNGKPVGLAMGGADGEVYYWGDALTLRPADSLNPPVELIASIADKEAPIKIRTKKEEGADKKMKLKIVSDGTREGTVIIIDGKEIKKPTYFNFSIYPPPSEVKEAPSGISASYTVERKVDGLTTTKRYELADDGTIKEEARWITVAQENTMPDGHFLWVRTKKTSNKAKDRKLPVKGTNGNLNKSGLRGAWAVLHGARGGVDLAGGPNKATTLAKCKRAIGRWNRLHPNDEITIKEESSEGGEATMELTDKEFEAKIQEAKDASKKETEDAVREEFKDHKSKEDVDKIVADEIKKASEKAVDDYKTETAKVDERFKAVGEAKFELTDYRKELIKKIPFTEEGDKEFASWIEDMKKDRKEVAKKPGSTGFKPEVAGEGDGDLKGAH